MQFKTAEVLSVFGQPWQTSICLWRHGKERGP